MTLITTSTAATATAYSNQRKIDRTSNGVLWTMFHGSGAGEFHAAYSTDDGATWSSAFAFGLFSPATYTPNLSFFIDQDDYAHIVYKDNNNGYIYYRRGTPNAARTMWTWSAALNIQSYSGGITTTANALDYPDVVAHREGTGWVAHVVMSRHDSSIVDGVYHQKVSITSAGVASVSGSSYTKIGNSYNNINPKYPSIDFNHTGDGKTVAGGTPHLYVAWSAGATGAGKGIRFKKATYSGGTWTWGTEREIDNTRYVRNPPGDWINCLFDGTRVVMAVRGYTGSAADFMLYERDAADTATITRSLNIGTLSQVNGSMSYDSSGNLYFVTQDGLLRVVWNKWTRSNASFGTYTIIDDTNMGNSYVSAKRGYSGNRIEFIYTDGTASPYSVTYDSIKLNQLPTAPTSVQISGTPRAGKQGATISWTHNDPDGDPQTKYKFRWRKV